MSDLLQRSIEYAQQHGITVIPCPGPFDGASVLIPRRGRAYLGMTVGTLRSPLIGVLIYYACESLVEARQLELRTHSLATSA